MEALSQLDIHLDRVCRNYLFLQKKLKKGADCAAVVKADAYGLGAAKVVPELYKANCRHFYVAHPDEGIVVRQALVSCPREGGDPADTRPLPSQGRDNNTQIYVLHGPRGIEAEEFSRHNLIPVLSSPGDIEYWGDYAKDTGKKQPALLQIDTGMNRLGLSAKDVASLKTDDLKPLDLRYVMSHLACADEPDHPKNREQLEKFRRLTGQLNFPCRLSFANSSGIFLGEDYHFDQARPGCSIYGINPQPGTKNPMQGVLTLKVRILQTRDAQKGETVGYGASYNVSSPQKLAIISAGYADGLPRALSGSGAVYINGKKCPLVGRVSMDLMIADATEVSSHDGWAEVIGEHQNVDDVAAQAGTIGYEVLTSLGKRYKRNYHT